MAVTIQTNNVPREVMFGGNGMSPEERREFDYIDWGAVERGEATAEFVRFRGQLYDLNDTEGIPPQDIFPGWDQYITDSFFSGVLFRFPRGDYGELDTERVVCATFYT